MRQSKEKRESLIAHFPPEKQEDIRIVVRIVSALCTAIGSILLYEPKLVSQFNRYTILAITNGEEISEYKKKFLRNLLFFAMDFSILTIPIALEIRDIVKDTKEFTAQHGLIHRIATEGIHIYDREAGEIDYL